MITTSHAPIRFNIYGEIPAQAVVFADRAFSGGRKFEIDFTIDLLNGQNTPIINKAVWGKTIEYAPVIEIITGLGGKPNWHGTLTVHSKPIREAELKRTHKNLNCTFENETEGIKSYSIIANGGNPLVAGAPNIDLHLFLGIRQHNGTIEYRFSGAHDGFPSYAIRVGKHNNRRLKYIYQHDCIDAGESPIALFPPMDKDVKMGWTQLDHS